MAEEEKKGMSEQDKNDILSMDEATSYFLINECGNFVFRMSHDLADGNISDEDKPVVIADIENIRTIQKFTADNLDRFGVDPKTVEEGTEGEYWKWYRFWDDWKNALTEEEWKVVATGEYKPYLPKKKWNEEDSSET